MKKIILFSVFYLFSIHQVFSALPLIAVTSPVYCSDILGNTTVNILAPNCAEVKIYCWKQNDSFGYSSVVDTVTLDAKGIGSFVFPADEYPHGPLTLRISGQIIISGLATIPDNCYLQLYNKGGVSWNEGMPANPSAATGMNLVFSDDFTNMSIGNDGSGKTYYDHKPPYGTEDFSSIPFTNFSSLKNPFSQKDTYLRIRADANKNSTGLISSMFSNTNGFKTQAPCYFECRFIGSNAPGTWQGFWLLGVKDNINEYYEPSDELDIIEAYGGEGAGSPNSGAKYGIASHAWVQTGIATQISDQFYATYFPANMSNHGIPSTWYEASHIYGCRVGLDYTIFYCDNIEVGRHPTLPLSKIKPFYFMINLATGGGWPVDLSRYNGLADMYVDYVRVYSSAQTGLTLNSETNIDVKIYPNPVTSETAICLDLPNLEDIKVNICNVLGQSVFSYHSFQQGKIQIPINLANVSNGTYLAKINVGNLQFNKAIIK